MAAAAGAMRKLSRDDERWFELSRAMATMQRDMNALVKAQAPAPTVKRRKRIAARPLGTP